MKATVIPLSFGNNRAYIVAARTFHELTIREKIKVLNVFARIAQQDPFSPHRNNIQQYILSGTMWEGHWYGGSKFGCKHLDTNLNLG